MKKFYVDDCPKEHAVHRWIGDQTNLQKYIDTMVPENSGILFEFKDTSIDTQELLDTSEQAYKQYGWHGFMNVFGTKSSRSKEYGGLSLVYNPDYLYRDIPIQAQTLGYPRIDLPDEILFVNQTLLKAIVDQNQDKIIFNIIAESGLHAGLQYMHSRKLISSDEYIELKEKFSDVKTQGKRLIKDSYTDTWSFNQPTPVFDLPAFANIKSRIKRSIIRSRLAQIKNINTDIIAKLVNKFTWHRDDSWFYELRINLSLDNTDNNFGIEVEDYGKQPFKPGHWYMWDTLVPHRPYIDRKAPGISRTNFVLAVNPWFDYDEENRCWIQNEFFGEKHPVDMVLDGDVIQNISKDSLQ